jgi:hypothetical protein
MHYGPLGLLGAAIGGWSGGRIQQFESARLLVEAKRPHWILLDGDPVRFDGPVEFRFIPNAIRTFVFDTQQHVNDNPSAGALRHRNFNMAPEQGWNLPDDSHVAITKSRERGNRKPRKQV